MHQLTIDIAKYLLIVPVLIVVLVWVFQKKWSDRIRMATLLVCGGLLAILLAKVAGHFFYDTRPFVAGHFKPWTPHAADNGFPSDHTLLAAFLTYVVTVYSWRWGLVSLACAIAIGAARVIIGVHHITDIIGSFVIAGAGFLLGKWIVRAAPRLYRRNSTGQSNETS
ncbi:MAG TPA: phosphatase PAP2 family protein [Candidatus Saccharimonadales bacterium]|nr:phosphatase PAP2 family protein [Candidatus Saccharimonadales bacterium]